MLSHAERSEASRVVQQLDVRNGESELLRYALHDKRRYRNLLNSRFSASSAQKSQP
jgi:hypothetical protein